MSSTNHQKEMSQDNSTTNDINNDESYPMHQQQQQQQNIDSEGAAVGSNTDQEIQQPNTGMDSLPMKSGFDDIVGSVQTEAVTENKQQLIDQQEIDTTSTGISAIMNVVTTSTTAVNDTDADVDDDPNNINNKSYTLIAKYGKQVLTFDDLSGDVTIGEVKLMIENETRILSKRQKLVGLQVVSTTTKGGGLVSDDVQLYELKVKPTKSDPNTRSKLNNKSTTTASAPSTATTTSDSGTSTVETDNSMEIIIHQFILMGTPEEAIFVDPAQRIINDDNNGSGVIDDFDFEYNAGTDEWYNHVANEDNLRKFTESTPIHIMNEPRDGKPLLVLDLDHTLLDFSSRTIQRSTSSTTASIIDPTIVTESMKRPYMDHFLSICYQYYDIVVWSQTSWRWLETKLIELGMITNPNYKFCFVLDKTSMFTITSTLKSNKTLLSASTKSKLNIKNGSVTHHVKPLQIIWSKFNNRWNTHNTVHIDDLSRNFALNIHNGIKIKAYYRKKASSGRRDIELLALSKYLIQLATCQQSFTTINFSIWSDVAAGRRPLLTTTTTTVPPKVDNNNDNNNNNNNNANT
jgi:ubiquitin-like domain-containing CTD phosphatase 1